MVPRGGLNWIKGRSQMWSQMINCIYSELLTISHALLPPIHLSQQGSFWYFKPWAASNTFQFSFLKQHIPPHHSPPCPPPPQIILTQNLGQKSFSLLLKAGSRINILSPVLVDSCGWTCTKYAVPEIKYQLE